MFDNSIFYFEYYNFTYCFGVYKMETRILWLIYVHGNKQKNYCLWAKKMMDNNTFSGEGENYCSVVVVTIMFLCFDVKV